MDLVYERIRDVRKRRGFSQDTVGSWFESSPGVPLSGASWGRKERGLEHGLEPSMLQIFIKKMEIDARYLFGQIDSFEKADLKIRKEPDIGAELERLRKAVSEKIPAPLKDDKDYEAFAKPEIRTIVRLLKPMESGILNRVLGYIERLSEEWRQTKKERAS